MGVSASDFVQHVKTAATTGEGGAGGISKGEYEQLAAEYKGLGMLDIYSVGSKLAVEHHSLETSLRTGKSYAQYCENYIE